MSLEIIPHGDGDRQMLEDFRLQNDTIRFGFCESCPQLSAARVAHVGCQINCIQTHSGDIHCPLRLRVAGIQEPGLVGLVRSLDFILRIPKRVFSKRVTSNLHFGEIYFSKSTITHKLP